MVSIEEVSWETCQDARAELREVEILLGKEKYDDWSRALKSFLCAYFSADRPCIQKQGKSISPVASGVREGKGPGCGKSGGLRLAVCGFRKVCPLDSGKSGVLRRGRSPAC
jgi:hypothetical protein